MLHWKEPEYKSVSKPRGTFPEVYHILCHKESLSKYKRIKIVSSILPVPSAIKQYLITINSDRYGGR